MAIISTDLDLHHLRADVQSVIEKLGFDVLAFERPDYPVYPSTDAHAASLAALQNSDMVVLLIDKRYGGLFLGKGPESITEREYFEAYKLGKIIIPCVSEKAEHERQNLISAVTQLTASNKISLGDARIKIRPEYVDNWNVLDFIDEVRKADRDNFVIEYDGPPDLSAKLEGRFRGFTRFICHKIVEAEIKRVKSTKTTVFPLSLGDVFEKGYFVEPNRKVVSGNVPDTATSSQICDLSHKDERIMITGGPGTGKSTLLAKAFLEQARTCLQDRSSRIPFYISLRGRGPEYHFDFREFVLECCREYLGKQFYPAFERTHIEPVFYIDGLDEFAEQSSDVDLQKVLSFIFLSRAFVACSRSRFAEERLESLGFASRIDVLIALLDWEPTRSWTYIKKFCDIGSKSSLYEQMMQAYGRSDEMKEIFQNPLLLTMFLYVVEQSGMTLPLDLTDQVSVYDRFIDLWITRELGRLGRNSSEGSRIERETIRKAWQLTAWEIYKRRFTGESMDKSHLQDVVVAAGFPRALLQIPVYWDFLDIRPHTGRVLGMFHEQFLEHLLASEIVSSSKDGRHPFPEFLQHEIRYEINKIVRALWKHENRATITAILENLWAVYEKTLLSNNEPVGIAIRNHAMYYIGRLPDPEAKQKLVFADSVEKDPFVKLAIAFGLIKLEDYQVENELFEKLTSSDEWDAVNRGYHLVYFGDWILKDELPPYLDDGARMWTRTLQALLRHIQSTEKRHVALRRIELLTIRRFMEVRTSRGPMNKQDLRVISESVAGMKGGPHGFLEKVVQELRKLETVFETVGEAPE